MVLRVVVFLTIVLLSASLALAQPEERVVPSERVTTFVFIRAQPTASSAERGRLEIGQSLPLVGSVPRWYQVRFPDGTTGFVSKSWTRVTHGLRARQEDELRIHFLQVGSGSCTVVECPGSDAPPMIVDCGTIHRRDDDLTNAEVSSYVGDVLAQHDVPPNVVLSHGDRDHYSFIPQVLSGIQVSQIWQGGVPGEYKTDGFPDWIQQQRDGVATVHDDKPAHWHNDRQPLGSDLSCGLAHTFVLTVNTGKEKNTHSLVLMIEYEEFTVIFSGDAEGPTEAQAMTNFQSNVKATVLTGSHHGARTNGSNGPKWAAATAPDVVVFSAGEQFRHPTCTAVGRFTTVAETIEHAARCGDPGGLSHLSNTKRALHDQGARHDYHHVERAFAGDVALHAVSGVRGHG